MQSGGAAWFNRVSQMDVSNSMFVANTAVLECGAVEMNGCLGNVHDSIFSWNKVGHGLHNLQHADCYSIASEPMLACHQGCLAEASPHQLVKTNV